MKNKVALTDDGTLIWECPGCGNGHGVPVVGAHRWEWNQSLTKPTLSPSVKVLAHPTSKPFKPQPLCHIFMRDGRIEFLSDCGHALVGKTIEMEDFDA
jgi:Family of unknown function (DUF6527)